MRLKVNQMVNRYRATTSDRAKRSGIQLDRMRLLGTKVFRTKFYGTKVHRTRFITQGAVCTQHIGLARSL